MNTRKFLMLLLIAVGAAAAFSSCESGRSYSELLNEESKYVNAFLADQRVIGSIPADTIFEYGTDAPYYQLDDEGNIYMQVINPGSGPKAEEGQRVYFRFMRYNLSTYTTGGTMTGDGNESDMSQINTYFDFNEYTLPSSSQYGSGIQLPLNYLPLNCEVNLVVKSQYGFASETTNVQPYLYHIRYYKSQI